MGTIAPARLHDLSSAADFVALTGTQLEIITAENLKQELPQGGLHLGGGNLPMREAQIAPPLMPHR
jgi:hypothetical protein